MKHLRHIFFFLGVLNAMAATRYSVATGNWNDNNTWSATLGGAAGASYPTSADDANITGGFTVTIPSGTTSAVNICIVGSNSSATLIQNGTLNVTATTGSLVLGTGTGKEGNLTLGPDSITDFPNSSNSLNLRNCTWNSTSTSGHMARLTGAGIIRNTTVTDAVQSIVLNWVSIELTGTLTFILGPTTGSATNQFYLTDCIVDGWTVMTIGTSATPNTTPIYFLRTDFWDATGASRQIIPTRAAGGTAAFGAEQCTFVQASNQMSIIPKVSGGWTTNNCVMDGALITEQASGGVSGSITTNNLMGIRATTGHCVDLTNAGSASVRTVSGNYLYSFADNMHPIVGTGTAGSGTMTITGNIMEGLYDGSTYLDKPDLYIANGAQLATNYANNLVIGTGEHWDGGGTRPSFATATNIYNNTLMATVSSASTGSGHIFVPEGVAMTISTGSINVYNNVYRGNGNAGDIGVDGSTSGGAQTVTFSDYNVFKTVANPYATVRLTVATGNSGSPPTVPGGNDTTSDPKFFSETRTLARWNGIFGSGTATGASAFTYFHGLNGYAGTPGSKGTPITFLPSAMIAWVAYGASPTNLLLRGTGQSGADRGAMPVRTIAGSFF